MNTEYFPIQYENQRKTHQFRTQLLFSASSLTPTKVSPCLWFSPVTYPSTEDLVDGCTLFQCAFCYNFCSHFLHIQHKCIKRFLYVWLLFLFFFFGVLMFSEG